VTADPIFVATADVDWASEFAIAHFVRTLGGLGIRPTLFATHPSEELRRRAAEGSVELGIHPNLRPGSTHGETLGEVLDHLLSFVPRPVASRSHSFFDSRELTEALVARGVRTDSNQCSLLQSGITPIRGEGSLRLPVFWEDDAHWIEGLSWSFEDHRAHFFSPGLKILNAHPFMFALNVPDGEFYRRHKGEIPTLTEDEARTLRNPGPGSATFLLEALEAILAAGHSFVPLSRLASDLWASCDEPTAEPKR
jgi:hypothetical protein